ncbi:MAG TPA: T9SS type A sorting domain-containing protein [Bacteroidetes bacterium]|nr:T9SS type A sorting domain-containing protein [Bacteroidota bacterium]
MKTNIHIFAFLLFCKISAAQTLESGDVFSKISTTISNLPAAGGNQYLPPSANERADWTAVLTDLFAGNYSGADTKAALLGYDLVQFSDIPTGETYYILEKTAAGTNYWGTYILNPNACRSELVLMAPHPKKDFNTGKEAIYCFQELDARFFMLAGTNRCNSSSFSSCSGTTTVCTGSSEAYRVSDPAHVTDAIWQATTEYVHDNVAGTYFVQLHGFTKQSTDPYVIMSNGTRQTPVPDKLAVLKSELETIDPVLTFKVAHLDLGWNRLIGFTNTNGRYINSSANACSTNAVNTDGRFLHLEQEKTRLRNDITGWNKMGAALGETFNSNACPSLALLPVELVSFAAAIVDRRVRLNWETSSEVDHAFFAVEKSTDGFRFFEIGTVAAVAGNQFGGSYEYWDEPSAGQVYYRLRQVALDGSFEYSKTISLDFQTPLATAIIYFKNKQLAVVLAGEDRGQVFIFDHLGQVLAKSKIGPGQNLVDVPPLLPGIYFYKINFRSGRSQSGKLWKG